MDIEKLTEELDKYLMAGALEALKNLVLALVAEVAKLNELVETIRSESDDSLAR